MTLSLCFVVALWAAPLAAETKRGRALFDAEGCRSCHSIGGIGGDSGPDLSFVGFRRSPEWLEAWLRDPKSWKRDTLMPNPKLAAESRRAIVAYLSALKGQDSKPKLFQEGAFATKEPGRLLFARTGCVACHGVEGRGGHPNNNVHGNAVPALRGLARTYSEEELRSKIRRGSDPQKADPAGPQPLVRMPAWGEVLSEKEISAVAGYLLSLSSRDQETEW